MISKHKGAVVHTATAATANMTPPSPCTDPRRQAIPGGMARSCWLRVIAVVEVVEVVAGAGL